MNFVSEHSEESLTNIDDEILHCAQDDKLAFRLALFVWGGLVTVSER